MKSIITILFVLCFLIPSQAQVVSGKVFGKSQNEKEILMGATLLWLGTTKGTITNELGVFEIISDSITDKRLVVRFVGYETDTVTVTDQTYITITLEGSTTLSEVIIRSDRPDVIISDANTVKTEVITQKELGKSACCDLAGCFETQGTVQPQTTNVITNAKELRILGLSGVYNQVLMDGMPLVQGLSYTYGISAVPGTLVDNIYVSKGANSVLQGFESISGQINVEPKEGDQGEKLLLNAYINSFQEKHFNTNYSVNKNKWSNITSVHTVQPASKFDRDDDQFLDLPLLTRYMFYNKLKYNDDDSLGWSSRIGIRFVDEQRIGGQTFFNASSDAGTTNAYGQVVKIQQPDIYTKTGYRFNDDHKITFIASSFYHKQDSWFGTVKYNAGQLNVYGNLQHEWRWKEKYDLKTGISYRYMKLDETISFADTLISRTYSGNYLKEEMIPGIFAENTFRFWDDKLTWITGLRGDWHNQFGFTLTPRTMMKYEIKEGSILRASAGTGWRTVNMFSENINLLASSRDIVFVEQLRPERAFNTGINFTHKFEKGNTTGLFTTDFYHTGFQNQFFPDYNTDPTKAYITNFSGRSVSNGFQTEISAKFFNRLNVKVAYNYLEVFRIENGTKNLLPFNPKHKVLNTFSFKPLSDKWHFDMNVHWYGKQKLPETGSNPIEFQRPDESKPYTLVSAQFTYSVKQWELYTGCENIFDFRQKRPVISWENPYNPYFDTSSVWGPTRGREVYIGVRFKIKK